MFVYFEPNCTSNFLIIRTVLENRDKDRVLLRVTKLDSAVHVHMYTPALLTILEKET